MNSERIKHIQNLTAYPESLSVMSALMQVWHECAMDNKLLSDAFTALSIAHLVFDTEYAVQSDIELIETTLIKLKAFIDEQA